MEPWEVYWMVRIRVVRRVAFRGVCSLVGFWFEVVWGDVSGQRG